MSRHSVDKDVLARRAARFRSAQVHSSEERLERSKEIRPKEVPTDTDYEFEQQLVGTCQMLEKCYLRLTAPPKESDVRPRHVLLKSLARVKELWANGCGYQRASELFKSIRQDMTVQSIRDELSIDVYETHARLALLSKDPAEFNVCLTVLESLYKELPNNSDLRHEFKACRILYYLFTRDLADLTSLLGTVLTERRLQRACRMDSSVNHAVDAAMSWFLGCHHRLLQLYKTAPELSSLVMDLFLDRERIAYFIVMMTAYRPSVPTDFISSELLLDKNDTVPFLSKVEAVFTDSTRTKIDCKATLAKLR